MELVNSGILLFSLLTFSDCHSIGSSDSSSLRSNDLVTFRTELMYPYNLSDFTEINSVKPLHDQPLPFRLPFFGFTYHYIWITRDGYLTFNKGLLSYKFPLKLPILPRDSLMEEDPSMIAPWFALQDIPTEVPNAGLYFKIVNLESETNFTLRDRIYADFREGMVGSDNFKPKFAMIITWRNMTMVNRRPENPLVTNTYQCVLATDEIRTFAMFNYEQIQWITHQDNYEGLKGAPAFVGFNAGNTTRALEYKPYSQNPRISYLTTRGLGNGLKGRHFFQLDEEVYLGSCIEKDLDPNLPDRMPLTFNPRSGNMLGGTLVNITGPCVRPDDVISCRFENFATPARYIDDNRIACITPPVIYHGYVDLTVTVNDRTQFLGQFYMEPPGLGSEDVVILDDTDLDLEPDQIVVKWHPSKLSSNSDAAVNISLWTYKPHNDVYPRLTHVQTLVTRENNHLGRVVMSPSLLHHDTNMTDDITMGFIAITLTDPGQKQSPVIWSRPMPLAWFFKKQWDQTYGAGEWQNHFCQQWIDQDSRQAQFISDVPKCPCTLQQAELDKRFIPDTQCNVIDRKCQPHHLDALACYISGRPGRDGSGQTCCYDDYNELIRHQDSVYSGRPSRAHQYGKHPFKLEQTVSHYLSQDDINIVFGQIPVISEYLSDEMPFLFCYKWQSKGDNSDSCQKYNRLRPSDDCIAYQSPAVGAVYGDPHVLTFDRFNYTFNGKGEYTLLRVNNQVQKIEVQGRFEQLARQKLTEPTINGTQLRAVAVRDNISSVVEFRARPSAATWRYHMFVIVDKQYINLDEENPMKNFRGVSIYEPQGIQNMSHVIASFDSGLAVEVMALGGQLTVRVYVPQTFENQTSGLLGKYNNDIKDDFTLPDGTSISVSSNQSDIHYKFGQSWRVADERDSLFFHDSIPFAYYDSPNFEPELHFPLRLPEWAEYLRPEMEEVCSDWPDCQYDYIMTMDREFARNSKQSADYARWLQNEAGRKYTRCPALSRPLNGRKSENRYWPGTLVRFTCDQGYQLKGSPGPTRCDESGHWSVTEVPQCLPVNGTNRDI